MAQHTRAELAKKILENYPFESDDREECLITVKDEVVGRFALIERGTGQYKGRRWLTTHNDLQAAVDYHTGQEYGEDWTIEIVIDLDNQVELEWDLEAHLKKTTPWDPERKHEQ